MGLERDILIDRLRRDLIGPDHDDELIGDRPSDCYLTGILWPKAQKLGQEENEKLGAGNTDDDNGGEQDEAPISISMRPCVAGVSFALAGPVSAIDVTIKGAYYALDAPNGPNDKNPAGWRRKPLNAVLSNIKCGDDRAVHHPVPGAPPGLELHVRSTPWHGTDARLVTVTLVNNAVPEVDDHDGVEAVTLFQTWFGIKTAGGSRFVPRPDYRPAFDAEDESAALLFRNAHEYAVGHTCSAEWTKTDAGDVIQIATDWLPTAEVAATSAGGHKVFEALGSEELRPLDAAWLADAEAPAIEAALHRLPMAYRDWIRQTSDRAGSLPEFRHREAAMRNLAECESVALRMENGIRAITADPRLTAAFRLANLAMSLQASWKKDPKPLVWRPFQLAFILLTAPSAITATDPDRETMDLLWFPTGGGKTEAYLGLVAFLAFARRLTGRDRESRVAAVMRYTLRLLTTQQFERAAALVMACEAIRRGSKRIKDDVKALGEAPFGIGLWVGGDASPNTVAEAANGLRNGDGNGTTPRQITRCPACAAALEWKAHYVQNKAIRIDARCINRKCMLYAGHTPLPIHTVDEDIYRARPTLLIGTVDKFAQVLRRKEAGRLFDVGGSAPPDLIIQDELHLISGPLGTVVGLYEAGIDRLFRNAESPPKVVGSTATIRRAAEQIRALFNRSLCQFPPPGIDADDSGFAVAQPATEKPGRLYLGVTTAGRSAKFTLQAVSGSLLQSGFAAFGDDATRDPYWTLVAYFNSLRELGGAYAMMLDDVPDSLKLYASRRGGEKERIIERPEELTSNRTQSEIRDMLASMEHKAGNDSAIDVLLASNMLSVGVDISRLGLMLVNGQPKGIAEYIQATSRVGRSRPGLVVVLLNNLKPRDRSRYETFRTWHATLYRDVETTSVTPFAPRARDRALHAALMLTARHIAPGLLERPILDDGNRPVVDALAAEIAARASKIDAEETEVPLELKRLVDLWASSGAATWWNDRDPRRSLLISAETAAAMKAHGEVPGSAIPTPNSMRNVEASVPFRIVPRLSELGNANG